MEDADHVDLATWTRAHGAMPAPAAVVMIRQLADALDASPGTHGDMVAADVELRGLDGTGPDPARLRAHVVRNREADDRQDQRSDVAALGRVLHEALTGALPAGRADAHPDLGPDVPAGLREVVATATSSDPSVRYHRAGDLAAAAESALERPALASVSPDTLVRPVSSGASVGAPASAAESDAPSAGTLVRPLLATTDPSTTLDRPIAPVAEANGTLNRPIEPIPEANGTLNRPIEPIADAHGTLDRPIGSAPIAAAPGRTEGAAPGWTTTSTSTTGTSPRRSRRAPVLAALVAGLLLAAALAWFVLQPSDLEVQGATVVSATGSNPTCDATVDLVGTIRTNGRAGTVTYSWSRSDGSETGTRSEQLDDGVTSVDVHLLWQVTGQGRYPANATLLVSEPNATEARTEFVYDCR